MTAYYERESDNNENQNTFKDRYEEISRRKDKPKLVYPIWPLKELLAHSDVETVMFFTPTVKSQTIKEAKAL